MTPVVDRIETAADRIKDDEFLADKKRVTSFFCFIDVISSDDAANMRHSSNRSNLAKLRPLDCPLIPRDTLIHAPILAMFPLYIFRPHRLFLFLSLLMMPHFRLLVQFLRCHS